MMIKVVWAHFMHFMLLEWDLKKLLVVKKESKNTYKQ